MAGADKYPPTHPSLHPHLYESGPLRLYPPRIVCPGPFNLCRSHTLPLCATSNLHSHFIPPTHRFPAIRLTNSSLSTPTPRLHHSEPTPRQDCHLRSGHRSPDAIVPSPWVWCWSSLYPWECVQTEPGRVVTRLECHLLAGRRFSVLPIVATKTEQHCHLLLLLTDISANIFFLVFLYQGLKGRAYFN